MRDSFLLHHLIARASHDRPQAVALIAGEQSLSYGDLYESVTGFAGMLDELQIERGERVAVWLDKRFETVVTCFGAAQAGCVFVPINPLLKPEQVGYILADCNVRLLVTSDA